MTTQKSRTWPLAEARDVAEALITLLQPACMKVEVAGSVRRLKPLVGDIELLGISKVGLAHMARVPGRPPVERVYLDERVQELIEVGVLDYRLNKLGRRTFGPLNKLLVHVPSGISVDLFSTEARYWGMFLIVRTGSREFNIKVMSRFRQLRMIGHAYGGVTTDTGEELDCPTEEEVFRLLQWPFVPPEKRV